MEMTGESRIEAPRDRVWAALNDPEVLRASIPGCEELERAGDDGFTAKVRVKVGPVNARFSGKVTLSDIDPPNGYRISGEGTGGAAGFAKGGAVVTLEPDGDATVLRYAVDATVGGKLAQIGSRLIDGTARKMADDFFARFKGQVEGVGAPAAEPPEQTSAAVMPQVSGGRPDIEAQAAKPSLPDDPAVVSHERPADTLPSEPPAHAAPNDRPLTIGALDDPVTAAAQPAAVDRATATMHGATQTVPEGDSQAARDDAARSAAPGETTAGPGGYRAGMARRTAVSPWVWGVGVAAVILVLILALT